MPATSTLAKPEVITNAPLKRGARYDVQLAGDGSITIRRKDGQPCSAVDLIRAQFIDKAADLIRVLLLYLNRDPSADTEARKWTASATD